MKKIIILLISLFLCPKLSLAISASSYIVMDEENNSVLMGENIHEPRLIASTTKIMTCILAIENADLDKQVTITKDIHKAVGSSIYLEVGEKIALKDLLYGMMLRSGNDAATMIAIYIAGDMSSFAKLMNQKAQELKMENTIFYNSHGLEESSGLGNKSTSYDMALLTSYAMKNKKFQKIFRTKEYTCKSDKKTYHWQNKNKLLKYDYITGGKTGFTQKARRTLVTTGNIDGKKVIVVTLNDPNDWQDHQTLYNIVKDNYILKKVIDKEYFNIKDDTFYTKSTLYVKSNYNKIVLKEEENNFKIKYYLRKINNAKNNDNVGNVVVYFKDKVLYKEPIYIKIKKDNIKTRIVKWFKNLFS